MNEDKIKKIKKTVLKIFIAVTAPIILMVSLFLLWDYYTFRTEIYTNFNSEQLNMISEDFKFEINDDFDSIIYYSNRYIALINLETENIDDAVNKTEILYNISDIDLTRQGGVKFNRKGGYPCIDILSFSSPSIYVQLFYYTEKESYYLAIERTYLDDESKEFYLGNRK